MKEYEVSFCYNWKEIYVDRRHFVIVKANSSDEAVALATKNDNYLSSWCDRGKEYFIKIKLLPAYLSPYLQ